MIPRVLTFLVVLLFAQIAPAACSPVGAISTGQTLSGQLSSTDCKLSDGSSVDIYTLAGTAGQKISLSLTSSEFDAYLLLYDPAGSKIAQDDNSGGGTQARIPASGYLSLPSTGSYQIYANSARAGETGSYSLSVTSDNPSTEAAEVIEFYHAGLDHYFMTADPNEAAGLIGNSTLGWVRTGNTFKSGGSTPVCRFYGSMSPGPNSHFYTLAGAECDSLKKLQASTPATEKRWNFESLDFYSTPQNSGVCPSETAPVYRAYNNGYARGIDSNHRITRNLSAIQEVVARGWIAEGITMCAPPSNNSTTTAGTLQFGSATYTVAEYGGSAPITVTRSGGSKGKVTVNYATSNGTATAGADYSATSGILTFEDGDTTTKTVSIPLIDDTAVEGDETVLLTLSSPTGGAALGAQSSATLTITDNDTNSGTNTVTLLSPGNGASDQTLTPTLSWSGTGNPTGYWVFVATDQNVLTALAANATTCSACLLATATGAATSYTPATGVLLAGTKYFWRARSSLSALSSVASFTTAAGGSTGSVGKFDARLFVDLLFMGKMRWSGIQLMQYPIQFLALPDVANASNPATLDLGEGTYLPGGHRVSGSLQLGYSNKVIGKSMQYSIRINKLQHNFVYVADGALTGSISVGQDSTTTSVDGLLHSTSGDVSVSGTVQYLKGTCTINPSDPAKGGGYPTAGSIDFVSPGKHEKVAFTTSCDGTYTYTTY
jgi:hypothetical protein